MKLAAKVLHELKHLPGWHSSQRYIAFAVDDYGSIRTANARAAEYLRGKLPGFGGQMDEFDAVETREDLERLFEVLSQHADCEGTKAIFTAYCLSANPNFEVMRRYQRYECESIEETYSRLQAEDPTEYEGTWAAFQQGMHENLIRPQCHGREHFCVPLIESKLRKQASDLLANLEVDSMAGLSPIPEMPGVGFTHAFGFQDSSCFDLQRQIIADGLSRFKQFFGFPSTTFTPPASKLHPGLDGFIGSLGVRSIDKPLLSRQYASKSNRLPRLNFLKSPRNGKGGKIVRTLSFEPCSGVKSDPVGQALREIEVAFRWRKPAIISSHRVNYGGHIAPANRESGLSQLDELLGRISRIWPDIRFVSVDELVNIMESYGSGGQLVNES